MSSNNKPLRINRWNLSKTLAWEH